MAGEDKAAGTTTTGNQTPGGSGEAPPSADPPAWFQKWSTEFSAKVDGRIGDLGRDLAKVRGKLKRDPGKDEKPTEGNGHTETAPAVSQDDLAAAVALGELKAQLPAEARAEIDEMVQARGFSATLDTARLLAKFSKSTEDAKPSTKGAKPITGHAATAATNPAQHHPTSLEELMVLRVKDPKAYEALMDPSHPFDPASLPRRTPR